MLSGQIYFNGVGHMLMDKNLNDESVKYSHPQYSFCVVLQMGPSAGVTTSLNSEIVMARQMRLHCFVIQYTLFLNRQFNK